MIKLRRDTAANWTSANPVLGAGQPGIETDTLKWKIGDGSTAWASLSYMGGGSTWGAITGTLSSQTDLQTALNAKQDTLVSGTNIKTVNSTSLLGSGNISIGATLADGDYGDITVSSSGTVLTIDPATVTLAKMANMATASLIYRKTAGSGAPEVNTLATLKTDLGLTGTNSGDQTITLTGAVTGSGTGSFATSLGSFTKAQLDAAVSDGNVLYVGDVTQYTDEAAQDAVGAMLDASLVYTDATPLLQRAALTGDVTASAGSNTLTLATVNSNVGSFGSASAVATFTVNGKGLLTAAGSTSISIGSSAISDLATAIVTMADTQTVTGDKTWTGAQVFRDNKFTLQDNLDNTKQADFQLSGITTGTTRTYNLPDIGGGEFVMTTGAQTITGDKTFTGAVVMTDSQITLKDNADPTKAVAFQINAISTGTTRTFTFPDFGGATFVTDVGTQTITGDKTFSGAVTVTDSQFVVQDNVDATKAAKLQLSGITTGTTRTFELPDVDGIVVATTTGKVDTTDIVNLAVATGKIAANAVTNGKLAQMAANTVKANDSAALADPNDVALGASQLLGRGSTGNIAAITLGTNLSMSGTTLDATGGSGTMDYGLLAARAQGVGIM